MSNSNVLERFTPKPKVVYLCVLTSVKVWKTIEIPDPGKEPDWRAQPIEHERWWERLNEQIIENIPSWSGWDDYDIRDESYTPVDADGRDLPIGEGIFL